MAKRKMVNKRRNNRNDGLMSIPTYQFPQAGEYSTEVVPETDNAKSRKNRKSCKCTEPQKLD